MEKSSGPDNIERGSGYGATLNQTENMVQQYMALVQDSFFNSSPKIVAESIVTLLEKPYGKRPFRTLVDPSGLEDQVTRLNNRIDNAQQQFLHLLGIEQMATVKRNK